VNRIRWELGLPAFCSSDFLNEIKLFSLMHVQPARPDDIQQAMFECKEIVGQGVFEQIFQQTLIEAVAAGRAAVPFDSTLCRPSSSRKGLAARRCAAEGLVVTIENTDDFVVAL